jgi:hypothetical protein
VFPFWGGRSAARGACRAPFDSVNLANRKTKIALPQRFLELRQWGVLQRTALGKHLGPQEHRHLGQDSEN